MQQEMLQYDYYSANLENIKLVLSDGTKVWLNSASKVKYPVAFTGGQRGFWSF